MFLHSSPDVQNGDLSKPGPFQLPSLDLNNNKHKLDKVNGHNKELDKPAVLIYPQQNDILEPDWQI